MITQSNDMKCDYDYCIKGMNQNHYKFIISKFFKKM